MTIIIYSIVYSRWQVTWHFPWYIIFINTIISIKIKINTYSFSSSFIHQHVFILRHILHMKLNHSNNFLSVNTHINGNQCLCIIITHISSMFMQNYHRQRFIIFHIRTNVLCNLNCISANLNKLSFKLKVTYI